MTDKLAEAIEGALPDTAMRRYLVMDVLDAVRRCFATCPTDELVELLGERLEGSLWTGGYHLTGPKEAT